MEIASTSDNENESKEKIEEDSIKGFKNESQLLRTVELRQIPIEIIEKVDSFLNVNKTCDVESEVESMGSFLDLDESSIQQLLTVGLKSNRTSLIITHEDGTTEETETQVTCLGVTPEANPRNSLHIQEIVLAANKIKEELHKQEDTYKVI